MLFLIMFEWFYQLVKSFILGDELFVDIIEPLNYNVPFIKLHETLFTFVPHEIQLAFVGFVAYGLVEISYALLNLVIVFQQRVNMLCELLYLG